MLFSHQRRQIHFAGYLRKGPKTVANFVELAEGSREWTHPVSRTRAETDLQRNDFSSGDSGLHDQGGDPAGTGMGGPGTSSKTRRRARAPLRQEGQAGGWRMPAEHERLAVFYHRGCDGMVTGKHTIFGEVVEGQRSRQDCQISTRNDKPVKPWCWRLWSSSGLKQLKFCRTLAKERPRSLCASMRVRPRRVSPGPVGYRLFRPLRSGAGLSPQAITFRDRRSPRRTAAFTGLRAGEPVTRDQMQTATNKLTATGLFTGCASRSMARP